MTDTATSAGNGNLGKRGGDHQKDTHSPRSGNVPENKDHAGALAKLSHSQDYNRAQYQQLVEERKKAGDTGGAWGTCIFT